MRTLNDLTLSSKNVLLRVDFNVPIKDGVITDDGRIRAALATIQDLLAAGCNAIIITAHLGRPDGEVDPKYSLAPVASRLSELLSIPVKLVAHQKYFENDFEMQGLMILENIRFDSRETSKNDAEREDLARGLAKHCDVFVSDGFGVVHRKQASVYDVAKLLPAAAGRLIAREVEVFQQVLTNPTRPYTVILGGAKVSDKLKVIDNLLEQANTLLIGGGMSYTFLHAMGYEVGESLLDLDSIEAVKASMAKAEANGVDLILPIDLVVAREFSADAETRVVSVDEIEAGWMGLDIGPKTRDLFRSKIINSATVIWNGPVGVFELEPFSNGTRAIAQAMVDSSAFTVIGGGDSAAAIRKFQFSDSEFGHVSTGGGASLEYLEGKELPGLVVLRKGEYA